MSEQTLKRILVTLGALVVLWGVTSLLSRRTGGGRFRADRDVAAALEGLDDAAMARQPTDQCNSVAWILWHLTRVTDTFIHSRLRDLTQVWVSEGWHQKFGMPADAEDRGVGWSAAQVAQWQPPAKGVQLAYYESVKSHTRDFLASITADELERTIVMNPVPDPRTVAVCMGQMVWDTVAHGGQIAYLRGCFRGMGWFR